jgi:ParE toxin of type II toxin-antitoxin system, parDE
MTDRFRLTKPAIQDIEEIADYIAQQSGLEQSEQFLSKLESKFSKSRSFLFHRDLANEIHVKSWAKLARSANLVRSPCCVTNPADDFC